MADRGFPIERIPRADGTVNAARIECCDCEAVAYSVVAKTGLNPKAHEQYFRKHGWEIGNGPRRDKCPSCQQKKSRPELKVVENKEASVETPREMSRDDRRIITDKLDEVYGENRYVTPWTDAAVARDLGVPRAWVERVRDEFFGPEGSNPEFDDWMEKAAPIIAEMKNMANSARVQLEQVKAIEGRISEIERIGRKIEKELGK